MGFDGILDDLEGIGYEVGTVEIPACAVNAPHIRQRIWIIGCLLNPNEIRCSNGLSKPKSLGNGVQTEIERTSQGDMAHAEQRRPEAVGRTECDRGISARETDNLTATAQESSESELDHPDKRWRGKDAAVCSRGISSTVSNPWDECIWTPCADGKFRRTPDDSFGLADGLPRKLLAALGDSIVPQVAYQIIKAIKEAS